MQEIKSPHFDIIDLGQKAYDEVLQIQMQTHEAVAKGQKRPTIYLVEHLPVLTLGKNAADQNLLFSRDFYKDQGIAIFEIDRGGEVTAHMPGQLVVYPILNVTELGLSVRSYVQALENCVINTLSTLNIPAGLDPEFPGVWVGAEKVCAIGVRIKQRTTMHGLALNVNNELSLFQKIVPCGIQNRGVTSLAKLLQKEVSLPEIRQKLVSSLTRLLAQSKEAQQ